MIEIADGLFIEPGHVAVVKRLEEGKCALFVVGQSALDGGFLLDREAEDVCDEIDAALAQEDDNE